MTKLSTLPSPFIVCVLTNRTVSETVATLRLAALDGADAYELNLPALGELLPADLEAVFGAANRPIYTSCRRAPFMAVYGMEPGTLPPWDDETRMERQIAALRWGAVAIDMELDTFDPHPAPALGTPAAARFAAEPGEPAELTRASAAIARQREIIDRVHALGGEVIGSCHTGRPQSTAALIEVVEVAVARGADLVKVVSPCVTPDDLFALLAATTQLKERAVAPFILIGAGEQGMLSRVIGCNLGSGWFLAQQSYQPGGFHAQPLVSSAREIRRLIPWRR